MPLPIAPPYETVDDVVAGLTTLERACIEARDRRGVFVSAYIRITHELIRRIEAGRFHDGEWLASYIVAFAELHRRALAAYEADDREQVPKPWRVAFDAAVDGRSVIVQDLILGINAHINHDLPIALRMVSIDPHRQRRYEDHTAVNDALRETTNTVQERLSQIYVPALGFLDLAGGEVDEVLTNFSFEKARDTAWMFGTVLVDAEDDEEAVQSIRRRIDDQAGVLANLVLRPNERYPWLFDAIHRLEEMMPHWRQPFVKEPAAALPPAVLDQEPIVHSFDEVIARLEGLIARFDEEESRLSIYPTIYLDVTKRIEQAVAEGHFEDPAWLERLDLLFASQYFRILDHFEAGRRDQIPSCWRTALEAAVNGETVALQDIVLAVNARLNHDLGIALFQAGLTEEDTERRTRDYKRIHDIFSASINPVQEILARKYSAVLGLLDRVAGGLDELVVDFLYTQARDTALDNAFTLANADSEEAAREAMAGFDRRATKLAQTILLRPLVGGGWIVSALRQIEARYRGPWSDWVQETPSRTLYQRLLGDAFAQLPPPLSAFHGRRNGGRATGKVEVVRGRGAIHGLLGWLLRLPPAGEQIPLRLQVVVKGEREHWFRVFESDPVVTLNAVQRERDGVMEETFGPMRLGFRPSVKGDGLHFEQAYCRLGPLTLPRAISPRAGAELRAAGNDEEGWHIDVHLEAPLLGLVLRYRGRVVESEG